MTSGLLLDAGGKKVDVSVDKTHASEESPPTEDATCNKVEPAQEERQTTAAFDSKQPDTLQPSENQVHQQQAQQHQQQQHHPHTQHLPMTEFVIDDPSQWLFDPSFGFPTDQMFNPHSMSQALQPPSHVKAEAQQTMNPQFLNYHFTLPTQAQMEMLAPSFLESTSGGNALTAGFTAGLGFDTGNMHDYSQQQNDPLASMHAGYDGSKYATQGISITGPHYRGDYQQQQPAIPPQELLHDTPVQTTNAGIGLGLGLGPQVNNTPMPSVLHHHLLPTTISPVVISNTAAAHPSLLSAAAALTLPDNPAALNAKAPDPSLKLGKRRFVSLRVFSDGEAGFQRKVVRYALQVCQQPTQGKTFTEKDRRPIVHPPILRLWLVDSYLVNPLMAGYAESLPELLDDDSLWLDRVMDISPVDTANYMCIVDALAPEPSTDSADSADAHVPTGYRLCNSFSLPPLTASPTSISPSHPSRVIKAGGSAHRKKESTTARTQVVDPGPAGIKVSGRKRGSERESDSAEGSGSGSGSTSKHSSGKASGHNDHRSPSSGGGEPVSTPPPTDSSSSSFSGPSSGPGISSNSRKRNGFRIPAAPPVHGSSITNSAPSASSTASGKDGEPVRQKRNLFGNWAIGCRKMYGMGATDDLGIWFMFNDISIQQPGQYALRFRCFDLTEASDTPIEEEAVVTAPTEQGRDTVLVPGEDLQGTTSGDYSRGPMPMDVGMEGEDVKPFAGSHGCASSLSPTQTTTATMTAKEQNAATAAKAEARALCEVVSDQFTVWSGKGMPSWPGATALTGYFSR